MNDTLAIALATGIPLLLAQAVNVWISHKNTKKLESVETEAKVITAHVNSAASADAAKIDALEKEIVGLKAQASERREIAALLAQSVSFRQEKQTITPVEVINKENNPVPITETK